MTRKIAPHWVIINATSIWKKPFLSHDEAKREFVELTRRDPTHKYVIEQHEHFIEDDTKAVDSDGFTKF